MAEEKKEAKMKKLEDLGVDARYLGMSRKMHHKFATIDSSADHPVLITGSTFVIDQALNPNEELRHTNAVYGWRRGPRNTTAT